MNQWTLVQDQSAHWYLIPANKIKEWEAFCNLPDDDERSWEAPLFAKAIGGCPSRVTFEKPRLDGNEITGAEP